MPRVLSTAISAVARRLRRMGRPARVREAAPAIPFTPEACLQLADTIERHLREGVLALWFPRCIDRQHGGFRQHFREDWTQGERTDKGIVFQSRMTWVCAEVARRLPDLAGAYREHARHGYDYLANTMHDKTHGGFYWSLEANGALTAMFGDEKHAYGAAFAIYALSSFYRTTGEPRALELAQDAFRWLDEHAHDSVNAGYYEALSRDGAPIMTLPKGRAAADARTRDCIGTGYGFKSMNSHIHLLEAFTELFGVLKDARVEERLRELFQIIRDRVAVEPGCLNMFFTPDWRPLPDHDSFGHDIEAAYLLLEATAALGEPEDARTLAVARSLVDHALQWGWDHVRGGFYSKGAAFAETWAREKIVWVQAEGLNALLLMHERFGANTPCYWDAFVRQWDFIWKHQIDHVHGEWFRTVAEDGTPQSGNPKGSEWKAAYHNGRALLNVTERLRRLARQ